MSISSILNSWYLQKKRKLPWRSTRNPYYIWVSEVILQQTRVAQGTDYYLKFVEKFPNVESLALAQPDEVLKMWQGLGYYSRARNLHAGAKDVMKMFDGKIPNQYELLLTIKGIGPYTAAAISAFAFDLPQAVVDGNVNRVISRLFGVFEPVNSTVGTKIITQKAYEILDKGQSAEHNQAIMEFGALQCVPRNPDCSICPLQIVCFAYIHQQTEVLPQKFSKKATRHRFFNYLVISNEKGLFLTRRNKKDIWEGLYEFPLIESQVLLDTNTILEEKNWQHWFGNSNIDIKRVSEVFIHKLSHQTINARFFVLEVPKQVCLTDPSLFVCHSKNIQSYPVHKLIENYINNSF